MGRGFASGLPCQASSEGDQPFASSPFAHPIPQSYRRASGDLFSASLAYIGGYVREIGAFEAKNKLGTLLDWVENGEEVLITRHGKAVARLVPAEPGFNRAKARQVARGLLDASRGVTLGGLKIKDLINEGRL
jgi:prevent-host-death family protein